MMLPVIDHDIGAENRVSSASLCASPPRGDYHVLRVGIVGRAVNQDGGVVLHRIVVSVTQLQQTFPL